VAADAVGAAWARSCSTRPAALPAQTETTKDRPCDAVVMAIVDEWEIGGREVYRK